MIFLLFSTCHFQSYTISSKNLFKPLVFLLTTFAATYGGAATLPKVLEGKCDQSTCSTLETDLDVVESCMTDFNANTCTFKSTSTSLPAKMIEVIPVFNAYH